MTTVRDQNGWWAEFFSGLCLEYVLSGRDEEQTRAEMGFIHGALGLPRRAKVLDVPCGAGRLALELAAWGYDVTGIDQSAELVATAREEVEERDLRIDFRHGDMRDLPEDGQYDGLVCLWNSFGYFDDAGNLDFLRAVFRSLKPGGRLALEERGFDHETGRLDSAWTFIRDGVREVRDMSIRLYTYRELVAMLEEAGFGEHEAYGSLEFEPFELGAPWLYLVTTKVEEPEI